MALKPCPECGNPTSTTAKSCPKCGAKLPKSASPLQIVIVLLIAAVIFGPAIFGDPPVQTEAEKAQAAAEQLRIMVAKAAVQDIKNALRDPDSLVFDSLRVHEDGTIVCAEYRAKNGFGGYNRELVVVTPQSTSHEAKAWNTHCTQPLIDMRSVTG